MQGVFTYQVCKTCNYIHDVSNAPQVLRRHTQTHTLGIETGVLPSLIWHMQIRQQIDRAGTLGLQRLLVWFHPMVCLSIRPSSPVRLPHLECLFVRA
jgi:hypothetical protein